MNILITGAKGFVGKNLYARLKSIHKDDIAAGNFALFEYDMDTDPALLDGWCKEAGFVFHLAGVNRPESDEEFMAGNFGFTSRLLDRLKTHNNACPIMISSSTQAALDNPYGRSKRAGEELMFDYGRETGSQVYVYRLTNLFGKWCRPNYNSACATFCHNIANGLEIQIRDRSATVCLCYIDDLIDELLLALAGKPTRDGNFCKVLKDYTVSLGVLADLIYSFRDSRDNLSIPNQADEFTRKLYATYLSYLPEDKFSYPLKMNVDNRGSFTEFIRTPERGQVSINISRPGITKGDHWHDTKNEKFMVVSGSGVIRFRKIGEDKVIEYPVSGDELAVVDIPAGYTHSIENTGGDDMVTVMWASEPFDPGRPDTVFEPVINSAAAT